MTARISVCYGKPTDTHAFDSYYARVHIPLANRIPGLKHYTYGKVRPLGSAEPPYYSIANLYFNDSAEMAASIASPEMNAAGADLRNFASGGVTMFVTDEAAVGP